MVTKSSLPLVTPDHPLAAQRPSPLSPRARPAVPFPCPVRRVTASSDAAPLLLSFSLPAPRLSSSPPVPQVPPPSSSEGRRGGTEISKEATASSALLIRWWWRPAAARVAAEAGRCLGPQEVGGRQARSTGGSAQRRGPCWEASGPRLSKGRGLRAGARAWASPETHRQPTTPLPTTEPRGHRNG
jgi:hypothetical protein